MEVTKWLKRSDSVSRLADSASVQAITRVNAVQLEDQLLFLRDRDPGLYSLIETIQREELMHLDHAEERIVVRPLWSRPLASSFQSLPTLPSGCRHGGIPLEWPGISRTTRAVNLWDVCARVRFGLFSAVA
jgi:hypothetical protein